MGLQIRILGARGSLPAPYTPEVVQMRFTELFNEFFDMGFRFKTDISKFVSSHPITHIGGYGGNTPSVEVRTDSGRAIIDGGSGIRNLGYELMNGPCGKGKGEVHIFFTHFHWDHLIGLPFFTPIFIPGNQIHVYAVQEELPEIFSTVFKKPYFPVPLNQLGAQIHFHKLEPRKPFELGDMTLTPYQLDHPDPCWGYRVDHQGRAYAHCVDTECTRVSRDDLGPDLGLYQDVDVMVFDAQYTLMEAIEKINWGHAAASMGLDIALREGIRKVVFMHHDPASSDEKIKAAESEAKRYYESLRDSAKQLKKPFKEVDFGFAYEGMIVDV